MLTRVCAELSAHLDPLPGHLKRRQSTLTATSISYVKKEIKKLKDRMRTIPDQLDDWFDEFEG